MKATAAPPSHGADIRHLAVGRHQFAGLDRGASFFGRLLQIVPGFGAIGKFLSLLQEQSGHPLVFEFALHAAANFFEGRSRGGLDRLNLEHRIALRQLHLVGRSFFRLAEDCAHELRRIADAGQIIGAADEVGAHDLKAFGGGGLFQSVAAGLREQCVDLVGHRLGSFLLLDALLDLIFDFVQCLHVGGLLVVHADDVKTVTALYQIAGGAFGEGERRLFKLRNGAASADESERTAVLAAAGIFGIFLRQFSEVSAGLHLLQYVFRLLAGFLHALGIGFAVRSRGAAS